jgi:formate transporter
MKEIFGLDAFSPSQIAERVEHIGVVKARLPLVPMFMLGVLAGAFIALGALFYVVVISGNTQSWGLTRLLGGMAFSLGLIMVVIAGAELFTGNNLLVMAWADGKIKLSELLKNWSVVFFANAIGACGIAWLVLQSNHLQMLDGELGLQYLKIAKAKTSLNYKEALFSGILCNLLVCLAVWMSQAGRSVTDKMLSVILPVAAFVAAGFEHSIANLYLLPVAYFIQGDYVEAFPDYALGLGAVVRQLIPVIIGNIIGGGVLVAVTYNMIYGKGGGEK